ncbi:unnamed protein product, partial [Effrenium voratum]
GSLPNGVLPVPRLLRAQGPEEAGEPAFQQAHVGRDSLPAVRRRRGAVPGEGAGGGHEAAILRVRLLPRDGLLPGHREASPLRDCDAGPRLPQRLLDGSGHR